MRALRTPAAPKARVHRSRDPVPTPLGGLVRHLRQPTVSVSRFVVLRLKIRAAVLSQALQERRFELRLPLSRQALEESAFVRLVRAA
jgi:hypothetical protein